MIYRLVIAFIFLISSKPTFAHSQHVHQYIVVEAYKILTEQLGYNIQFMHDYIGGLESSYLGDHSWQKPYITSGAWLEDEEDVIYGYKDFVYLSIIIENALTSITHFWNADEGDLPSNMFYIETDILPPFYIGPYENAYVKLLKYSLGDWVIFFPDTIECINIDNGHQLLIEPQTVEPPLKRGITVSYSILTEFYESSTLNLISDQNASYTVFDITDNEFISSVNVSRILVDDLTKKIIVWEVLGRMCHLLADLSVPAHTHNDEHGILADDYESWMGGPEEPYVNWNSQNVNGFINPFTADNDPLHYLMYTMQQQSDHFGSTGPGVIGNGNDSIGGNPRIDESNFFNFIDISTYGEPTTSGGPWDAPNLENIRDKTFPYVLKATAGLLYWFAMETNLITGINYAHNSSIQPDFKLYQNFPNPFNSQTTINYSTSYPSHVTIKVFDVLGKEISTIVNEDKSSGTHSVKLNSSELASGIYFYTFLTDNYIETKKMIVLN